MKTIKISLLSAIILLLVSCSVFKSKAVKKAESKMNFEFSKLDKEGLIKKKGTSLAYEFCIPNNIESLTKIKAIDESISIYKSGTGRIGCSENEILCIGETHNKNYKSILLQIAELDYVKSINESFFE